MYNTYKYKIYNATATSSVWERTVIILLYTEVVGICVCVCLFVCIYILYTINCIFLYYVYIVIAAREHNIIFVLWIIHRENTKFGPKVDDLNADCDQVAEDRPGPLLHTYTYYLYVYYSSRICIIIIMCATSSINLKPTIILYIPTWFLFVIFF